MPRKRKNIEVRDSELDSTFIEDNTSTFVKGSIKRVRLRNFMTYKDVEIKAGPYLNMILGPNGTGKSALVCGIIIGLGGDPSSTGRSGSLGEYINFNSVSAIIEIELFNPSGDNYVIERKIISLDNKCRSEWKLNGCTRQQREIRDFIDSLNIRVNNLCQFLPQEKVVEFAKMDSHQLLENTEKAAGNDDMFTDHTQLIKISKEIINLEKEKTVLDQQLATEENLNERMAEQVQRVREREEYKDKIDWLQKKKPWIEFENLRVQYVKLKDKIEEMENEMKKKMSDNIPLMDKVQKAKELIKKNENHFRSSDKSLKEALKNFEVYNKEIENITEKCIELIHSLEEKKQFEETRKIQIEQFNKDLELLKQKINHISNTDLNPQIDSVNLEISEALTKLKDSKLKKDEIAESRDLSNQEIRSIESDLIQIKDVFHKRMDLLSRVDKKSYEATQWLQKNRDRFKSKIYTPIMTQINVKNRDFVRHVEASIPLRDLLSFVCENVEDLKMFSSLLKKDLGFNINVVQAPNVDIDITPKIPLSELKKYKFNCFVKDLFEAPDPVTRYLCKNNNLHNIPVGNDDVDSAVVLKANLNLFKFYCGKTSYQASKSKYDHENVISTSKLQDPRCLTLIIDLQKKTELESKLEAAKDKYALLSDSLLEAEREIEKEEGNLQTLRQKKKDLILKRDERKILETKIEQKKEAIARKQSEKIDLELEKKKVNVSYKKLNEKKYNQIEFLVSELEKAVNCHLSKITSHIGSSFANKKHLYSEKILDEANAKFKNLENEIKSMKESKDMIRREAKQKKIFAQKVIDSNEDELPKDVKKKFKKLPNDLEKVDAEIRRLVLRMESMGNYDASVLKEFDKQSVEICKKKELISSLNADLHIKRSNLNIIKERWLPPLTDLISKINNNFSQFMARLNCAGEVILSYENPDHFEKYGITIKVKYRENEDLKELSAFHQSGGERSVATMIYMIALQELTKVPFRVVDEINQGMDDINERRVFDLIVETASSNSSQYFLLSPKLLSGLRFSDRMHIHVIYNGPKLSLDWSKFS